jgi:hypothetical protein
MHVPFYHILDFFFSSIHEGLSKPPYSTPSQQSELEALNQCEQSLGYRKNDHHCFEILLALQSVPFPL